jgi:hypothetical protein
LRHNINFSTEKRNELGEMKMNMRLEGSGIKRKKRNLNSYLGVKSADTMYMSNKISDVLKFVFKFGRFQEKLK